MRILTCRKCTTRDAPGMRSEVPRYDDGDGVGMYSSEGAMDMASEKMPFWPPSGSSLYVPHVDPIH